MQFLSRQKQEIKTVRIMIEESKRKADPTKVDRIHSKVQTIEGNIKNMKLKSREQYELLAQEENEIDAELTALLEKYEGWERQGDKFLLEYQNYKIGGSGSSAASRSSKAPRRAGSMAASSRLYK